MEKRNNEMAKTKAAIMETVENFSAKKVLRRTVATLGLAFLALPSSADAAISIGEPRCAAQPAGLEAYAFAPNLPAGHAAFTAGLADFSLNYGRTHVRGAEFVRVTVAPGPDFDLAAENYDSTARIEADIVIDPRRGPDLHGRMTIEGSFEALHFSRSDSFATPVGQYCIDGARVVDLDLDVDERLARRLSRGHRIRMDRQFRRQGEFCFRVESPTRCEQSEVNTMTNLSFLRGHGLQMPSRAQACGNSLSSLAVASCYTAATGVLSPPLTASQGLELCKGTQDDLLSIACFEEQRSLGLSDAVAVDNCSGGNSTVCEDSIRGVAWDYNGNTSWASANVEGLCFRAETSDQPAQCFSAVMHGADSRVPGGLDYGGGNRWTWQNALELCSSTVNANETIACFEQSICDGNDWRTAIADCQTVVLGDPPVWP